MSRLDNLKQKIVWLPLSWKFFGVTLGILIGAYVFGFKTTHTNVKVVYHILLIRGFLGALAGGVLGFYAAILLYKIFRTSTQKKCTLLEHRRDNRIFVKNLGLFLIFLLLTIVVWIGSFAAILRILTLYPAQLPQLALGIGIIIVILGWVLVGRRLVWVKYCAAMVDTLLLGPFNYIKLRSLGKRQLQIIWVGVLLLFLIFIFPPWVAYPYMVDNNGVGKSVFVGFHYISGTSYDVLGETALVAPEISKTAFVVVLGLILVGIICLLLAFNKSKRESGSSAIRPTASPRR